LFRNLQGFSIKETFGSCREFLPRQSERGRDVALKRKSFLLGFYLMLPAVLLMIFVAFFPILYGFHFSFYKTHYLKSIEFIGLGNYLYLLKDPRTIENIRNSLVYVFGCLLFSMPLGVLLAVLLNRNIRYVAFFRTIIIFPWVFSQTVTALLWIWLLDANFGPVNFLIKELGFNPINFLADPQEAMWAIIAANVWRTFPFPLVLTLAALQTVPKELYEAVKVDGGSAIQSFLYVTIPFIITTLVTIVILLSLENFKMVTLIYVMTGGGPINATEVLSVRAFKEAFWHWHMGYATALAMFILIINVVFGLAYIKVVRKDVS
jgi:multiple sugar transport system permease protein